jgi:hypothetical protein
LSDGRPGPEPDAAGLTPQPSTRYTVCMGGHRTTARSTARALGLLCIPPLLCLLLAGCPYSSDDPLSDPGSAGLDPRLYGTWIIAGEDGQEGTLTIRAFDGHGMAACSVGSAGTEVALYRLFVTTIDGAAFLNIRELGDDPGGWFFARYLFDGDRLVLRLIDDALFDGRAFPTPRDRLAFIALHLADPLLYAPAGQAPDDMVLTRRDVTPRP